jgi:hypothetical protein
MRADGFPEPCRRKTVARALRYRNRCCCPALAGTQSSDFLRSALRESIQLGRVIDQTPWRNFSSGAQSGSKVEQDRASLALSDCCSASTHRQSPRECRPTDASAKAPCHQQPPSAACRRSRRAVDAIFACGRLAGCRPMWWFSGPG